MIQLMRKERERERTQDGIKYRRILRYLDRVYEIYEKEFKWKERKKQTDREKKR